MSEMDPGESERKSELISFLLESLSSREHGDREVTSDLMSDLQDRLNTSETDPRYRKETQALLSLILDRLNIFGRDPRGSECRSVILSKYLDSFAVGTREEVDNRRKAVLVQECIKNYKDAHKCEELFLGGSRSDGLTMIGSDGDRMFTDRNTMVTYPGQPIHADCAHKIVLYMREADHCRPGYVTLQLGQRGPHGVGPILLKALVPDRDTIYISSDIYRESWLLELLNLDGKGVQYVSNGPSGTFTMTRCINSMDVVPAFHCITWPRVANAWITRPRSYEWPTRRLINKIVQGGCHIVPIGDTCSGDTFLQWRISLIKAERLLVHSFNHIQFKVYGLLKHILGQIKSTLVEIIGDADILCSYFLKIVMFTAIENSHKMFWQEKNLFYCFWFCFNILIAWVKAGYCPNYFFPANNMFQRKIHGLNQLRLFQILHDLYEMKWRCLSVGTSVRPIWQWLCDTKMQSELLYPAPQRLEMDSDKTTAVSIVECRAIQYTKMALDKALYLLLNSQSEFEEVLAHHGIITGLSLLAMEDYKEHVMATDNKTRYRSLRKCKRWLTPIHSLGTHLLYLATFHFQTGNYRKALEMCRRLLSSVWYYAQNTEWSLGQRNRYMQECCGHGYSLSYKMINMFAYNIKIERHYLDFCLPHLYPEISKTVGMSMFIPALPYAVFLSFLCCHELGDTSGRDAAIRHLIVWTYDPVQGGSRYWIVHTLLGICYETVGDNRRAIGSYWDSLQVDPQCNPALERIDALQRSASQPS